MGLISESQGPVLCPGRVWGKARQVERRERLQMVRDWQRGICIGLMQAWSCMQARLREPAFPEEPRRRLMAPPPWATAVFRTTRPCLCRRAASLLVAH